MATRTHTCDGTTHSRVRGTARVTVAVGVVAAAALTGGVAYAYWAATGTGTATAQSTTAVALQVSAVAAPTSSLYPGKTENLDFLLANGNPYPVDLTTLTAATVTSSDPGACPGPSITLPAAVTTALATGGYPLPTRLSVPAGAKDVPASLAGFLTMATSASDGCQGKTFTVSLSFSGSQV